MNVSMRSFTRLTLLSLAVSMVIGCRGAQVPTPPVTTVWQKLGVPQAAAGIRDGLVNRRGNFPGLERKPPLARIVDAPALDPESKLFEGAAEIKKKEDLKKQKIKALKYLAEVGCGCYNDDGSMEAALLEALNDCDEDVRLAAVEAIQAAAGSCCNCSNSCNVSCCTEKIQEKLMEMARGEDDGCFKEPSAEIRAAATRAYTACPPVDVKPNDDDDDVEPKVDGDEPTPAGDDAADTADESTASLFQFNNYTRLPAARHLTRTSKPQVTRSAVTTPKVEATRSQESKKKGSVLVVKHRKISD
jgi:hypothetical protein